jgi:ribosomal-protein-alanine N-acetyltransferase
MNNKIRGIYQHFKGKYYEVIDTGQHSENSEEFVIYRKLYDDYSFYLRPKDMFFEDVINNQNSSPRFKQVIKLKSLKPAHFINFTDFNKNINPQVIDLLSLAVGNATLTKLQTIQNSYIKDDNSHIIGYMQNGELIGIIGIFVTDYTAEIKHIAVSHKYRNQHIGQKLIHHIIDKFSLKNVIAETDNEAKGFYIKCGFNIIEFAGEHNIRFKCKLKILSLPHLIFENYTIRLLEENDAINIVKFYEINNHHLAPFESIVPDYFNQEYWQQKALINKADFYNKASCCLGIFKENEIIGMINFNNIIHGCFKSCFLGYKISPYYQGKGIMKNCLQLAINFVFNELNLHRISANYIPTNIRSSKLLESLGFKTEGVAKNYLYINGKWQDHVLTSLINENWQST